MLGADEGAFHDLDQMEDVHPNLVSDPEDEEEECDFSADNFDLLEGADDSSPIQTQTVMRCLVTVYLSRTTITFQMKIDMLMPRWSPQRCQYGVHSLALRRVNKLLDFLGGKIPRS
ncbi:unnamed protein product [Linum trigynum]|uniref:Uncharacterized protein n=1 Tax=Linum trigynum TaxID=586398 RepID=A0AAV2CWV2_9ROSI